MHARRHGGAIKRRDREKRGGFERGRGRGGSGSFRGDCRYRPASVQRNVGGGAWTCRPLRHVHRRSQLPGWLAENEAAFDLIFVDTPAHDTDTLADAAKLADLAIIVTEPTYLANAVAARIQTAFVQEDIEYAILLTRTPSQLNRRLNHWLTLHRELGTVVDAHLAYRVAYQDAVALGLGVVEYEPDGPAAQEVRAATDWILKKLELV